MNTQTNVAIFWDFENCRPQNIASGYTVANNIRQIAHEYGSVKLLKAYVEADSPLKPQLRSELQLAGVSLTDCPHNGRKEVADKMIIVDALLWALDNPPPSTIIIITNDRDFGYAISMLRLRQYNIVVISQTLPTPHICLTTQASAFHSWEKEILQIAPSYAKARSLSTETLTPPKAPVVKQESILRDRSASLSTSSSFVTPSSTFLDVHAGANAEVGRPGLSYASSSFGGKESPAPDKSTGSLRHVLESPWKKDVRNSTPADPGSSNDGWTKVTPLSNTIEEVKFNFLQRSQVPPLSPPHPPRPIISLSSDNDDRMSNELDTEASPVSTPPWYTGEIVAEHATTSDPCKTSGPGAGQTKYTPQASTKSSPTIPAHFRDLVSLLRSFRVSGMRNVLMSKIASQLPNRAAAMEAAGAPKFGLYCAMASEAGIVDTGSDGAPGTEWLRLRCPYIHDHEAALAYTQTNYPRFEMLVRTLSNYHLQGVEEVYQTTVAQKLIEQQLDLQPLGAPTFSSYIADAQTLGIVKLGKTVLGKDCISLDPAYSSSGTSWA